MKTVSSHQQIQARKPEIGCLGIHTNTSAPKLLFAVLENFLNSLSPPFLPLSPCLQPRKDASDRSKTAMSNVPLCTNLSW